MFTEKQLHRYADVLIWGLKTARNAGFKKNDMILIRYNLPAVRLAEILYAKLLDWGMNPVQAPGLTPEMEKNFYTLSNNKQLVFLPPGDKTFYKNLNGNIYLHAPESITHLSNVDPVKIGKTAVSKKQLKDILDEREESGHFGWTLCSFTTKALARHAKISMKEYSNQIIKACYLNKTAPVSHWQSIYRNALSIKKWLNRMKVKSYTIESKGIDLEITPGEKRKWIGISGHNIPSFELFLSPDWRGTRGRFLVNQPSYRSGNYVKNVRLEFNKGNVVKISADNGENFIREQLKMDRGAKRIGEFSLTDKRFSRIDKFMANTLFDENYGGKYGNCHIALGASYSDTYDGNPGKLTKTKKKKLGFNDSALHWDLVNIEQKKVTANLTSGKKVTIYENGKFSY